MPRKISDIRRGQGVWSPDHANGIIEDIKWSDKEVYVKFYNKNNREVLSFSDLDGSWDDRLNQWVMPPI